MGKKAEKKAEDMEEDESSDSDSSGSELGMSDEEGGGEEAILALQQTLAACGGYDYDAHADLVRALSGRAKMKELGKAREAFSAAFALHDDLWMEWIADEARIAISDKDRAKIAALYERALADFSSVPLWESYNAFLLAHLTSLPADDAGLAQATEQARAVAERAVASMGADVTDGHRLWTQLVDLELFALGASPDKTRARAAFMRQLAAPALGDALEKALTRFKAWETDDAQLTAAEAAAKGARAGTEERRAAEARVAPGGDEDVLEAWNGYIALEKKLKGGDARVRCVMERALAPCCLSPVLWDSYATLAGASGPASEARARARSAKNCPFSAELWCAHLAAMEKSGSPGAAVAQAYDRATSALRFLAPASLSRLLMACTLNPKPQTLNPKPLNP
ncbi:hypothetical protein T484DRAFT_1908098 [Baffinella frigidus]|nr:hypothetical protein T484DRAFT_1908098 [Cryptophyta sp. CCMP2293]